MGTSSAYNQMRHTDFPLESEEREDTAYFTEIGKRSVVLISSSAFHISLGNKRERQKTTGFGETKSGHCFFRVLGVYL